MAERKTKLAEIKTATLTIGGKFDTMDPEHMKWMSEQVQNGQYLNCPNGSHLSMYDDQQVYMQGLLKFLETVDMNISIVNGQVQCYYN